MDEEIALALEDYLADILLRANAKAMMVTARAKSLQSLSQSCFASLYKRPKARVTDRVGARIIVYHAADVDKVTEILRRTLEVRKHHSIDKRLVLGMREFGYRSTTWLRPRVMTSVTGRARSAPWSGVRGSDTQSA